MFWADPFVSALFPSYVFRQKTQCPEHMSFKKMALESSGCEREPLSLTHNGHNDITEGRGAMVGWI